MPPPPPRSSLHDRLRRLASALTPKLRQAASSSSPERLDRQRELAPSEVSVETASEPIEAAVEGAQTPPELDPSYFSAGRMARVMGMKLDAKARRLTRAQSSLELRPETMQLDVSVVEERAAFFEMLLAARFALDHRQAAWAPELERPQASKARQKKEIPSAYGERLPRLVSSATRDALQRWLGQEEESEEEGELLCEPFLPGFWIVFTLEVGRHHHVMTLHDAALAELSREAIVKDARYTLFYQAYKIKPEPRRLDFGLARRYVTSEGLGATRAWMLPDFDFDASSRDGFASIISRDELLVVEPESPSLREAARRWCQEQSESSRARSRYPIIAPLMALSEQGIAWAP